MTKLVTGMLIAAMVVGLTPAIQAEAASSYPIYRLYNKNTGEHFYTKSAEEMQDMVYYSGWKLEGEGFYGEEGGINIYRLKNPGNGDHHYTTSTVERDVCVKAGWKDEGVAWSAPASGSPVYRLYNPNKKGAGAHHYTVSEKEKDYLVNNGWRYEGISWYSATESDATEKHTSTNSKNDALQRKFAEEIVKYTNIERLNAGLNSLEISEELMNAAMIRAKEASTTYSHTRPNGLKCYTVLDDLGISQRVYNGENLAANHSEYSNCAQNVVKSWMNSSGHKANILRKTSDSIGVGCYIDSSGQAYFIQIFGNYHTERPIYSFD